MEILIILGVLFFAFIAWAPEQLTQTLLALAWVVMGLFTLVPIGQWIWKVLFS